MKYEPNLSMTNADLNLPEKAENSRVLLPCFPFLFCFSQAAVFVCVRLLLYVRVCVCM